MLRTDAPGNDSNRYTEGNPAMGIPATVVSAQAANFWQEEIYNAVVAAGLTPSAAETQLRDAILILASAGGTQFSSTIANNQAAAASITGLLFDKTAVKSAWIYYAIDRKTVTQNFQQTGQLKIVHDATDDVWRISDAAEFDTDVAQVDVVFSITALGQIQYTSSNLTGGTYVGTFNATVTKLNI